MKNKTTEQTLKLNYKDKIDINISPLPVENKVTADDFNVIKQQFNSLIDMLFPVGSMVMTCDGKVHPLVKRFPACFEEVNKNLTLTTHNTINEVDQWPETIGNDIIRRSDLPNEQLGSGMVSFTAVWNVIGKSPAFRGWRESPIKPASNSYWRSETATGEYLTESLNGGTEQTKFIPKSLPIRVWKVIKSLS